MIYLDYSANTPADSRVLERFLQLERDYIANTNSTHPEGVRAAQEMDRITESIAGLLGVSAGDIIYTSGASEANNMAIKGIARASRHIGRHIISTPLEHSSVSAPLTVLKDQGWEIDLVDIDCNGRVDVEHLRELLRKDTVLVAVSAVDSELGTVQPVEAIAQAVAEFPDCRLHIDGTQAVGKAEHFAALADTWCCASHKFYGLNGSGVLVKKRRVALEPLIHGGSSTTIYRSGTPTLGLNGAFEAALRFALEAQFERCAKVEMLAERLKSALSKYPMVNINSTVDAVPHILNLSVKGVKGTAFQKALSQHGVCVSVKSACSVEGQPSRAVYAVSRDRKNALSSWRISLSHLTTEAELDEFLKIFDSCYMELVK